MQLFLNQIWLKRDKISRVLYKLPETAIWKNADLATEPKQFETLIFFIFQWPQLLSYLNRYFD